MLCDAYRDYAARLWKLLPFLCHYGLRSMNENCDFIGTVRYVDDHC
jgi:hypothetical protein